MQIQFLILDVSSKGLLTFEEVYERGQRNVIFGSSGRASVEIGKVGYRDNFVCRSFVDLSRMDNGKCLFIAKKQRFHYLPKNVRMVRCLCG